MRFPLFTLALAPLLLVQGISTRMRVPKLDEPPGPRQGVTGHGRAIKLLVLGDSAAAGVGAPHQDQALTGQVVKRLSDAYCVTWRVVARTGQRTSTMQEWLDAMEPQHYDVAVTSLGVNDVTALVARSHWRSRQAALRETLRNKFGVSSIVVSGLPPMHGFPALPQPLRWHIGSRATQFNRDLAADVADDPTASFVDLRFTEDLALMASDGFHPGPLVYAEWGQRVADLIQSRMQ